jgi:hypothetical protein
MVVLSFAAAASEKDRSNRFGPVLARYNPKI